MRSYLEEIKDRYEQDLLGTAERNGNILIFHDIQEVREDLFYDMVDEVGGNTIQYRRDRFKDITKLEFYSFLNEYQTKKKDDFPDIEEGYPTSVEEEYITESIYIIGDTILKYFVNNILVINSRKLYDSVAQIFVEHWSDKFEGTDFAIIDTSYPPFEE